MKLAVKYIKMVESSDSVEGMIIRNDAWIVRVGDKSKNFDKGQEKDFPEIKAFLNKAIHKDHNGSDFANDGEKYLFKKSVINKEIK